MSQVKPDVDLSALGRKGGDHGSLVAPPPRRRVALLVTVLLVAGFAGVLIWTLGDLLRGKKSVTVLRPRTGAAIAMAEGTALLQAAGWVEPNPFPMRVGALAEGVVAEVLVQESDVVKKGQPVAHLVALEAEKDAAIAAAKVATAKAEYEKAAVERAFAEESFTAALAVNEAFGTAKAELDGKTAEAEHRRQAAIAAEARKLLAEEELTVQRRLLEQGNAGPRQVEIAAARVKEETATLAVMRADSELSAAEREKARVRYERTMKDLELRIDDRRAVETAKRGVALAEATVREAEAERAQAALRLERMTVLAPSDGVVMARQAMPGSVVGPTADSVPICLLYDPMAIRVRVDVPQGEMAKAFVGQKVSVLAECRPGKPYSGEVLRVVQQADIQKVTMQVHVRLADPDGLIRPEMLVQARFLAPAPASRPVEASDERRTTMLVPTRLVVDGKFLWVVDADGEHARKRSVTIGRADGEWTEVEAGLNVSDKLIDQGRDGLEDGSLIAVGGE